MPNVVLLGYDPNQPSFRHRMRSLVGLCEAAGWQVRAERFPSGRYGLRTWERRELLRWADVVVLHQIKLSAHRGAPVRRASAGTACSTWTMPSMCASRAGSANRRTIRRWRRRKFARHLPLGGRGRRRQRGAGAASRAPRRATVDDTADLDRLVVLSGDAPPARRCRADHRLDRQSRESDLSGDDPPRAGAAARAPPDAQDPGDLFGVPGLAGDPGRAGAVERGHRGGVAGRGAHRRHAADATMRGRAASARSNCCSTWRPRCPASPRRSAPTPRR